MKKIDMHVHGVNSSDSIIEYRELCQHSISKGYSVIAFTEHYDLIDAEILQYGLFPIQHYFKELSDLRSEFPELEIIIGLEIGEPHQVKHFAQRLLSKFQPEYTIGALHVIKNGKNVSLRIDKPLSYKDIFLYYEENLEMVENGWFDTLGHLGIYKRGMQPNHKIDETHVYYVIDEIFRTIIKKGICLEINSSSYGTHFKNHVPEPEILKRYKELGGELITIGSDSHFLDQFDRFYNKTLDSLRALGFSSIYWKNKEGWNPISIQDPLDPVRNA